MSLRRSRTHDGLVDAIRRDGVSDERVLDALAAVPRSAFVPAALVGRAYADQPLPIPHDQVTTQPSLVARMLEALALTGDEKVLEVGTGYGFQTALLAWLARFVWSVERWADIADEARANLERQQIANAEVVVGDGTEGLARAAPFDAVVVSAAFPEVPEPLVQQTAPGGRLVQPLGPGGDEHVVLFERVGSGLERRSTVTGARFVRLYGKHAFDASGSRVA